MTLNLRPAVLSGALALALAILVGCAGLDPRRQGTWTLTAIIENGNDTTSATLTRVGPTPLWVEPDASLVVQVADEFGTATATLRYGTDATESASLFSRAVQFVAAVLLGRATTGAVP